MRTTRITTDFIRKKLKAPEWKKQKSIHEQRVSDKLNDYLERRQHQHKDPVMDFLFEYYAFRPSHLKRWSPGFAVFLKGATTTDMALNELAFADDGAFLDPALFPGHRKSSIRWILNILEKEQQKRPSFGCFGMHEWAMVYKKNHVRHNHIPLRMDKEELAEFVESRPLVCTHFDAFRFFSEPAKPLNKHELSREKFPETEQPGCIHTNMDLYKWAFKGYPWISSQTIWEAFELAVEARYIDMQASPYDLRNHGLEPIEIETEAGRLEYVDKQQRIYTKSIPVREKLIKKYRHLVNHFGL